MSVFITNNYLVVFGLALMMLITRKVIMITIIVKIRIAILIEIIIIINVIIII